MKDYDFAGWVTKNDILCADGVVIKHDAFLSNADKVVPLVWEHDSNTPSNVLGHVNLSNEDEGVYGYGHFNDTDEANHARSLIEHGDISAMSIAANHVQRASNGHDVIHGNIYEVSLVLAGANPGALIDTVVKHSATGDNEEGIIYPGNLIHSANDVLNKKEESPDMNTDDQKKKQQDDPETTDTDQKQVPPTSTDTSDDDKTIADVYNAMTDEQKMTVESLIAMAIEDTATNNSDKPDDGDDKPEPVSQDTSEDDTKTVDKTKLKKGDTTMTHNVFESGSQGETLTHSDLNDVLADAKDLGTLKDSIIKHSITNVEKLFPEAQNITGAPVLYHAGQGNADKIVNGISKSPFSRVKTFVADLTPATARAKGYIKGKEKLEEVFPILTRTTEPQTVYKKQKLDRDDIVDITDFDTVAWINGEMREMLNEEIARAILVGDGREVTAEDKIKADKIRPILTDDDLYTIKSESPDVASLIETVIKAMADYQGSGVPSLFINPYTLADLKLLKANDGRFLFGDIPSDVNIATRLGVKEIVPTTFLAEGQMIIVNLSDYTVGSTKGGEVTSFDDFDIDFNQYKYLIETRLSGALTIPHAAIAVTVKAAASEPKA